MSLTLNLNYDTVTLAGRTVKLVENYDNSTMVSRFVETVANCTDESAFNYILNTDYENSDAYIRNVYNEYIEALNRIVTITDTFGIETGIFGRNAGAGFYALLKRKNFDRSVEIIEALMHITGLDKDYRLVTRFENMAVYAIVRK